MSNLDEKQLDFLINININMTNIEVAIKHFKELDEHNEVVYTSDVCKVLNFLKQCEDKKMKLIGIGYTVYDGEKEYKDLDLSQMFEGGFAVAPRK